MANFLLIASHYLCAGFRGRGNNDRFNLEYYLYHKIYVSLNILEG